MMNTYTIHNTVFNKIKLNLQQYANNVILMDKLHNITWKMLISDVDNIRSFLLLHNYKVIALTGKISYSYIVSLLAILFNKNTILCLLDDKLSIDCINDMLTLLKADIIIADKYDDYVVLCYTYTDLNTKHNVCNFLKDNFKFTNKAKLIIFTSGTTSKPLPVELNGKGIDYFNEFLTKQLKINSKCRTITSLPLHHIYGLTTFLTFLANNATIGICDDLKNIVLNMNFYSSNCAFLVPLLTTLLANNLQDLNTEIKWILTAGAPLKYKDHIKLRANMIKSLTGYGATETTALISALSINDNNWKSVGKICKKYCKVKIEKNEILVAGKNIFNKYINNKLITKHRKNSGFFNTHDIGYIKNNELYLIGRTDRVIVLDNGKKICPEEIEQLIQITSKIDNVIFSRKNNVNTITIYNSKYNNQYINKILALNYKLPKYKQILKVCFSNIKLDLTLLGKIKYK